MVDIVGVLMENWLIPRRSDIDWEINGHGMVVITVEKILGKFEAKISDIFNAHKNIKRSLDHMLSLIHN